MGGANGASNATCHRFLLGLIRAGIAADAAICPHGSEAARRVEGYPVSPAGFFAADSLRGRIGSVLFFIANKSKSREKTARSKGNEQNKGFVFKCCSDC